MADIIPIHRIIRLPTVPAEMLEKAKDWGMDRCLVIGFHDDHSVSFGGSFSDSGDIVLLLELAKQYILNNHMDAVNANGEGA
jgi:hypothetical protein